MGIIDAHLHLVDKDRLRYPWLDALPALDRSWTVADYWRQAEAAGIEGAVHVEVDVAPDQQAAETAWITAVGPPVLGAVASCRPEAPGFAAALEMVAANTRVRGLRRILHTSPNELAQAPVFAENLRRLPAYGLSFDLCVLARQLPIALALARACPEVQFVLDHCGVPDVSGRVLDPWRADLKALAALPNVVCKVSGLVAYADPAGWTTADLRPFVEHAVACFGWDRVMWGSDWPVCTLAAELGRWVAATHELLAGTSMDERESLLARTARRIYRLG